MRLLVCCVTGRAQLFSTVYQKAPCPPIQFPPTRFSSKKGYFFEFFRHFFSFFHFFPTFFHFFPFFPLFLQKPSKSPKVAFFEARPPICRKLNSGEVGYFFVVAPTLDVCRIIMTSQRACIN